MPNLSENYLQCSLAEQEEKEFDWLDLADMNETTHDGNWDKWCLSRNIDILKKEGQSRKKSVYIGSFGPCG